MEIDVKELRRFVDAIFEHLERCGRTKITVNKDYYWRVPFAARYDPYNEPSELVLGRLEEHLERLRFSIEADDVVGTDLSCLAMILHAIGDDVAA